MQRRQARRCVCSKLNQGSAYARQVREAGDRDVFEPRVKGVPRCSSKLPAPQGPAVLTQQLANGLVLAHIWGVRQVCAPVEPGIVGLINK